MLKKTSPAHPGSTTQPGAYSNNLVWYPGCRLMGNMRFAMKAALISVVFLLAAATPSYFYVSDQLANLESGRLERAGVALLQHYTPVLQGVLKTRNATRAALGGFDSKTRYDAARQQTDKAIAGFESYLATSGDKLGITPHFEKVKLAWVETAKAKDGVDDKGRTVFGDVSKSLFALQEQIADRSNLVLDPELDSFYLINSLMFSLPAVAENIGQLWGWGTYALAHPGLSVPEEKRYTVWAVAVDEGLQQTQGFLKRAFAANPELQARLDMDSLAAAGAFHQSAKDIDALLNNAALTPKDYYDSGEAALNGIFSFYQKGLPVLDGLLADRIAHQSRQMLLSAIAVVCLLVLAGYLFFCFYLVTKGGMAAVKQHLDAVSTGDLSHSLQVIGNDELTDMSVALRGMVTRMSAMVASVRSNAELVSHAGAILLDGSRALSDRTEQQAANLEQTAASVQELASTVHGTAQAAQDSDNTARGVRDVAETGAQGMSQAIGSVEGIQSSTRRMDEIVGVIDGLAFQTNILALNAAVEAARAGESGRGFAVVASEVRSLAQRSAEASKEIRQLIGASSTQVATGVSQIRVAGENLTRVVDGIREVAGKMSEISTSSAEQSASLTEITSAVQQLDQITQQNAAMVEQSVHQASDLQARAANLGQAVAAFKLQQGTADEAHALVDRAMAHRARCGSRDAFLRDITNPQSGFFDRDMYVFVLDNRGTYLAFGGNPAKVGTRVLDIPGIDGQGLLDSIVGQASIGPGWVEYDITNPTSGKVQSKMSFVQVVDSVYLGCGVYKDLVTK
jgi:methyl-accepting chemotaxis protein